MKQKTGSRWARLAAVLLLSAGLAACSKSPVTEGLDTTDPNDNIPDAVVKTTTIHGKVTLSGVIAAGKPGKQFEKAVNAPHGKPGSKAYMASKQDAGAPAGGLPGFTAAADLSNATVELYSSDHPEWLAPIATADTNSLGEYTLSTLTNADANGNAYNDGDAIPAGGYTLIAYKFQLGKKPLVAVQTVVQSFDGDVSGNDLVASDSAVAPTVQTIVGQKKNSDGTQTWGSANVAISKNAAIQVTFSMAMYRQSLLDGIAIAPAVNGDWSVSPDWTAATFYPEGGSMAEGTYTITINGAETDAPVVNVYGNPVAKTATGTFTVSAEADTLKPTAALVSPEAFQEVPITTPIRIGASEPLDVNNLVLSAEPSVGARPGVIYLGEIGTGSYKYVYEFVLGESLALGTTYDIKVSGAADMAGNTMNDLTVSFETEASSAGIDSTADSTTQNAQAEVKDVFGKWVRALSDRNITQLQGLMTGDFVFQYDTARGISGADANKDGRLDLSEFTAMMEDGFRMWEYCGTTLEGAVDGGIAVNGDLAEFAFNLTATSTVSDKKCSEVAPPDTMYAQVKKVNGAWQVSTAAEYDIRGTVLSSIGVVGLTAPDNGATVDWPTVSSSLTFSWDAVDNATSYIVVVTDSENPWKGFAQAVSTNSYTYTACTEPNPEDCSGGNADKVIFGDKGDKFDMGRQGGQYSWGVIALGTTTVQSLANITEANLIKDIVAVSEVRWYKNNGTYSEIKLDGVEALDGTAAGALTFSDYIWGYDAQNANQIRVTVTSTHPDATTLNWSVSGHSWSNGSVALDAYGQATIDLSLYEGWNWISLSDDTGLWNGLSVVTTGGIPPVISISTVLDSSGVAYPPCGDGVETDCRDQGGFVKTTSAKMVTIQGTVDLSLAALTTLDLSLWNDQGIYEWTPGITVDPTTGAFTADVKVYTGDNWINLNGWDANWNSYWAYLGVYTDDGSVYVAPIDVDPIVASDAGGANIAEQTGTWGGSEDWDVSGDADNLVTITGAMDKAKGTNDQATYSLSSDGNWESGTLVVDAAGRFTLPVVTYKGWTWVSLSDGTNWYGVNIYNSEGKLAERPTIDSVNGTYDSTTGSITTTDCKVTIEGSHPKGGEMITAYWNGSWTDENGWYQWGSESTTVAADAEGHFVLTDIPVVSGTNAWNYVDIYDSAWHWTGASVTSTSSVTCTYTPPSYTVGTVVSNLGETASLYDNYADGTSFTASFATAPTTIEVSGTGTRGGKSITASVTNSCGSTETFLGKVEGTPGTWTIQGINVYDGYNYISLSDGVNWKSISVDATGNGNAATPALDIASIDFGGGTATYNADWSGCSWTDWSWDASGAADGLVTISGHSNGPAGDGWFYGDVTSGSFPIDANGNWTFDIDLYNGSNYVSVSDAAGNWHTVYVYVTNGQPKPKFITITSPMHGDTVLAGTTTVTGQVEANMTATTIYGFYYDYNSWTWVSLSSNPDDQSYGYSPIVYDATTGAFSFDVTVSDSASPTEIYVYAYDDLTWRFHYHDIYVNNTWGYGESWGKPAAKSGAAKLAAQKAVDAKRHIGALAKSKAVRH